MMSECWFYVRSREVAEIYLESGRLIVRFGCDLDRISIIGCYLEYVGCLYCLILPYGMLSLGTQG